MLVKKHLIILKKMKINVKYFFNNAGSNAKKKFLKIISKKLKKIFDVNFFFSF